MSNELIEVKKKRADEFQEAIINSTDSKIIVEAGAGSGKTYTLIERVRKLLEDGVRPENMVIITFTNMAAEELKERLVDIPGIGDCFVGTIHSFANKIFGNSNEEYKLFTEEIQDQFMSVLTALYGKHLNMENYLKYKDLRKKVDYGLISDEELKSQFTSGEIYEINVFLHSMPNKEYPENMKILCKKHNVITFDELLKRTTAYFKEIGGKIEYLFVDEYQDIGPLEKNFFEALNADNYFYVGDEKQAIYGFKGGDVSYFLDLIHSDDWKTYYLNNNYRCSQKIIDIANEVILQADDIISTQAVCKSQKEGFVRVASKLNLVQYLLSIKEGENYKDWFILVRSNKDLYKVWQDLERLEIPNVTFKKGEITLEEMKSMMNENKVKLLTIHASKGLESPNVLLWGNFPIHQKTYLRNSDERKVLYVGITRAINKCIILN